MKTDDGKTSTAVAAEFVTSISVPIIPDADEYMAKHTEGRMYTITVPDARMKQGGMTLPFTVENGRRIEKWMAKYVVEERGDKLVIHLEDNGHVRLGVRRGGH